MADLTKEQLEALPETKSVPTFQLKLGQHKLVFKDSKGRYWERVYINDVPHKLRVVRPSYMR